MKKEHEGAHRAGQTLDIAVMGETRAPDVDGLRPANDRGGKEKTMQHRRTIYDKTGSRLREAEACSGILCKWDAQLQQPGVRVDRPEI